MTDIQLKLETIENYLNLLLQQLPAELTEQVRILHRLIISLQSHLELVEMHQKQAASDLARLGEALMGLRQNSFNISDAAQKLQLLAALIRELHLTLDEGEEKEGK